ncbi:RING finger protein 145-like [Saccostrea echinata]|uniref:RING finger protein 145-like n=1 Tax=Saccostrea echinata TaxID=191078 RepID=UPI002A823EF7|nr:RING finger protein 145-like [Saccostrea echinata]
MSMKGTRGHLFSGLVVVLKLPALFLFELWCLSSTEKYLYQRILDLAVPIASTVFVFLPQSHILQVYKFLASVAVLVFIHFQTKKVIESDASIGCTDLFNNSFLLGFAGQLVAYLCNENSNHNLFFMGHIIPMLTKSIDLPFRINQCSLLLTSGIYCLYLICKIKDGFIFAIKEMETEIKTWNSLVNIFGFLPVARLISESRLLTQQLLLFWLTSFGYTIYYYITYTTNSNVLSISKMDWSTFFAICAGECCKTYLELVSMCVAVSYIANFLFHVIHFYVHGWKELATGVDHSVGWTIGILTFVLSVATGILTPSNSLQNMLKKGFMIKIISIYVASNFLNSAYEFADPALLSLSAISTTKVSKHIQGLIFYVFIIVSFSYILYIAWQVVDVFLTIPVIIISLSNSIQAIASIMIYLLFVYDGLHAHPLEHLDDIIYYIRSTVRFLDFAGSVVLACNGIWLIKSGGLSWIQYPFFVLHCYSNVWERFQNGWKNFMLRRNAVKMVDALQTATEEQIRNHDDVCSICLCPMSYAKITRCGHFFHRSCLKKWMYVGDSCPHCLQKLSIVRQS